MRGRKPIISAAMIKIAEWLRDNPGFNSPTDIGVGALGVARDRAPKKVHEPMAKLYSRDYVVRQDGGRFPRYKIDDSGTEWLKNAKEGEEFR
jgi:hypothetical protein